MPDAPRGDGRTGRAGFVSALKERTRARESGIGAPLLRNEEPLFLLIVGGCVAQPRGE